jgi:hypothetical protein
MLINMHNILFEFVKITLAQNKSTTWSRLADLLPHSDLPLVKLVGYAEYDSPQGKLHGCAISPSGRVKY